MAGGDSMLTPCLFSYSAATYKKSCLVFQLKRGVRSLGGDWMSIHIIIAANEKMEPAVRLKFTKVKSWFLFAYLRALPGKLEPYEGGEHTRFKEYIHFDVCYA